MYFNLSNVLCKHCCWSFYDFSVNHRLAPVVVVDPVYVNHAGLTWWCHRISVGGASSIPQEVARVKSFPRRRIGGLLQGPT